MDFSDNFHPDDFLYLAYTVFQYVLSEDAIYEKPLFISEFCPPNWGEKRVINRLEMILGSIKVPFKVISQEEIKIPFDEENITKISDFIDREIKIFSGDRHLEYAKDNNSLTFSGHIKVARDVLRKYFDLYGNSFVLCEDDFSDFEGFLFIHLIVFLWYQGMIDEIEMIDTQNSTKGDYEIYMSRIRLNENFISQDLGVGIKSSHFHYEPERGLSYKEIGISHLSSLEGIFCRFFYEKKKESFQVPTMEAIVAVYGDTEGENLDALKSLIKRLNNRLEKDLLLEKKPIRFSSTSLRKEV